MSQWSNRPSETRPPIGNVRNRGWSPKNASQFATENEAVQDDIRGLKLAQAKVQKDIETEKLEQKNVQLATEKENTKQAKEKFVQATYKTVIERTKTANVMDQTALATQSWQAEQDRLKTSLDSIQLGKKNDEEKLRMDRRAAVANFN